MAPYCNNYHRYHSNKCFKILVNFYLYFMLIIKSILCFAPPTTTTLNPVLTVIPPISNQIRETVVIPISENLEREAQELYNKALKEFAATDIPEINDICRTWEEFGCQCWDKYDETINLTCRGVNFKSMDALIWPEYLSKLELSNNNITMLPYNIFDLPHLRELVISSNPIQQIDPNAFIGLGNLRKITMKYCDIKEFLPNVFHHLQHLNFIQFSGNYLKQFHPESFKKITLLKNLYLDGNHVENVTAIPLSDVKLLEVLNLANNRIRQISVGDFPVLNNLVVLLLKRNQIIEIASGSFLTMKSLEVINLDDNQLTQLPPDLVKLHHLQELFASGNKIKFITDDALPKNLVILELRTNPLISFKNGSLHHMSRLRKLTLSDSKNLFELPSLHGCASLETLWVDRAKLTQFPNNLCQTAPKLKSLELKSNLLRTVPRLIGCQNLRMLDLSGNRIDSVHGTPFQGLISLNDLLLSHNEIETIPFDAFHGIPNIQLLDLEGNKLNFIHQDAFTGFNQIKDLNLGNNMFPDLPTTGLKTLNHLKTFNNPKLKEFPNPTEFPKIQTLVLSYAYHCCEFLPLKVESEIINSPYSEKVFVLPPGADVSSWFNKSMGNFQNISTHKMTPEMKEFFQKFAQDYGSFPNIPLYEEYLEEAITTKTTDLDYLAKSIQCLPLPDPFLPCQDLFDWWTLRCGVWVVFLLAMLGNGTVVFVLIFSRSKMDVPRFLVCNLAAADFFMGVYLGLLAVVDASTLGEFRMFAIPWQMSAGCQLAGFLAVLSSELSVYTLAVITLERNYAITHAMHLNKRLSLRHAGYIMSIGWMFALTMACLPLFGISDYRKFAVCLPFETEIGTGSLAYVVFLMFINGVAFLILMGCYLKMYCAIRGSQAWNSNDSRIAKRMALLVFTDFICWSPIAFFALTAVFGLQLISLEQAKVFTVFVLPLNSCCNPFLYAILTKQFKKDCVLICKAIEESRVTRGIGRCRHSSNFSNRQTPANTNSLVERSSRELMPPILPGQTCACAKLLQEQENSHRHSKNQSQTALAKVWHNLLCHSKKKDTKRGKRSDQYAHQIAEIQQKQHKRAGSMSSSENFSSSRSDSWRHGAPHHYCGIQLRKLDPRWRHSSWLITRKTSQDSNLSSSRNDSSGSNTTASTSTWRMSRSSAGASTPIPQLGNSFNNSISRQSIPGAKPRLVRQSAVNDDSLDLSSSPPRLSVRFLPTIPSAADSSIQLDDDCQFNDSGNNSASNENDNLNSIIINSIEGEENNNSNNNNSSSSYNINNNGTQYYAVLQSGNPLTTLSSPKDKTKPP